MVIGIISDTHVKKDIESLNNFIKSNLNEVDMLIHLGDYNEDKAFSLLKTYKNFRGVWGNTDSHVIKGSLRETEILEINDYRIGLFHGHGNGKTTMGRAYEKFKDDKVDIIIFGHSHMPIIQTKNHILFINPGSPNVKRKERWFSYVLLKIDKERISTEIRLSENKYLG